MNAPAAIKKRRSRRWHLREPGNFTGSKKREDTVRIEDIDMAALNSATSFSDWYEAVLANSLEGRKSRG